MTKPLKLLVRNNGISWEYKVIQPNGNGYAPWTRSRDTGFESKEYAIEAGKKAKENIEDIDQTQTDWQEIE